MPTNKRSSPLYRFPIFRFKITDGQGMEALGLRQPLPVLCQMHRRVILIDLVECRKQLSTDTSTIYQDHLWSNQVFLAQFAFAAGYYNQWWFASVLLPIPQTNNSDSRDPCSPFLQISASFHSLVAIGQKSQHDNNGAIGHRCRVL
jgi:hypothetical protein